jgi:hypothetical protein
MLMRDYYSCIGNKLLVPVIIVHMSTKRTNETVTSTLFFCRQINTKSFRCMCFLGSRDVDLF